MRLILSSIIQNVKEDVTSGSSEITSKLLLSLRSMLNTNRSITREEWKEFTNELRMARPGIAPVFNIAKKLEAYAADASAVKWNDTIADMVDNITQEEMDSSSEIADKFLGQRQGGTFLTMSYSSTVMSSLFRQKNDNDVMVYIAESLPGGEGRITAKKLATHNIAVRLIPDAMIGSIIDDVDCCLVGADAITPIGIINKVGTRAMAATCMTAGKTMYVLSSELKIAQIDEIDLMRTTKGGEGYPELSQMFELTPSDLIDHIITNKRVISPNSLIWK
jgi:translation initiation factor eIF-2B subunit alpha